MRPCSLPDPPAHVALRHGHWSIIDQACLVTTVTAARRRWFAHAYVAIAVARELGSPRLWRDHHVHAWVLMPDHLQVLLTPGTSESLGQLMARVKTVSGRAARAVIASANPFWAEAFHDRALRADEPIAHAARDLITHPVRAGLVDTLWAWPFWDSQWLPEPGTDGLRDPRNHGR